MADQSMSNKLPTVKETIIKRKRKNLEALEVNLRKNRRRVLDAKNQNKTFFRSLSKFTKRERDAHLAGLRMKHEATKPDRFRMEITNQTAFVIRIRPTSDTPEFIEEILKLFKLRRVNEAVFVKLNRAARDLLAILDKYVTWGYPSLKSIRDILTKRGKQKGKTELSDNTLIENSLGAHGIICLEDLVDQIWTCGDKLKEVCRYLVKFELNPPPNGWVHRSKNFKFGGSCGYRGDDINKLLVTMV